MSEVYGNISCLFSKIGANFFCSSLIKYLEVGAKLYFYFKIENKSDRLFKQNEFLIVLG